MTTESKSRRRQEQLMVRIHKIGDELIPQASAQQNETDQQGPFAGLGAVEPPYDLEILSELFELSNSLRPNIDAYAVNIEGFGHRLEPSIDLEQDDAEQQVADAILAERVYAAEQQGQSMDEIDFAKLEPTDEEVQKRTEDLRLRSRVEKAKLNSFFSFASQGQSFPALRRQTRQDLECLGNAYWEVLRNRAGEIVRFVFVPGWTVRLRPLIKAPVEVQERIRVSQVKWDTVSVVKRFRTFVQVLDSSNEVYFKQFGDPRVISRRIGRVFKDLDHFNREKDEGDRPASEIIHFKIPSLKSPYGIPRWMGSLLSVLGSRASEEVNYFYFDNKAIPQMAILVSGGRLAKSTKQDLINHIENTIKGRDNFHKVLVIEAVSPQARNADAGPRPQRPMIEMKPLRDAQQEDALFQGYDERSIDKVGGSFRLPRLLRGDSRDFNRATADAALRYAEDQVFQPERSEFDHWMDHVILPELGILFWRFRTNSPVARDPETMGALVVKFIEKGILTPAEGRLLAGDVFNQDFAVIGEPWTKQPISFTLAGIQTGQAVPGQSASSEKGDLSTGDLAAGGLLNPAQGDPPDVPSIQSEGIATALMRIRERLYEAHANQAHKRLLLDRVEEIEAQLGETQGDGPDVDQSDEVPASAEGS